MGGERIFLVGLSGSGKSTVAVLAAARLGWRAVDTDRMVEEAASRPVGEIFAQDGEAAFRQLEAEALEKAAGMDHVVVATGGGAPTTERGRAALAGGFSAWLAVTPATAAARLAANPGTEDRPLLARGAERALEALAQARRSLYAAAGFTIEVDRLSPPEVAETIVREWQRRRPAPFGPFEAGSVAARVATPGAAYPIVVEAGAIDRVGEACTAAGFAGRAFVISDGGVAPLYGARASRSLAAAGYQASPVTIPAGEQNKTLATLATVYDHLLAARIERSDFVVCLGGGVVTDLGGFAAATVLRGVPFVHVPTTLLGMVDASVGGKLGVDHPLGKNMVGAFAQPSAVVIDPGVLATLPPREVRAGLAELIKHGLILDEELVTALEAAPGPEALVAPEFIARSVAIKAEVVSGDERESGRRSLLNYGHTLGHAIESATGYGRFLHGEAVAIGMRAAGLMAVESGLLSREDFARQQALIRACGLPESAPGLDPAALLEAARGDKKARGGRIRWVVLEAIGRAILSGGVGDDVALRAAAAVCV